ncbi:hypothetical protein EGT74_08330 [Chitinophaga lutea]|uniref:BZIP transcription factor n=1 Tax=Chitinophaga lutea TaxID=2488634 RepID=A0A3N4QC08_9BACT|nr:hypothetical protein [Chitinophaga lutea]RPE13507.1 hypothetical protein EGT74_08330 [Chitinophaga lutea]
MKKHISLTALASLLATFTLKAQLTGPVTITSSTTWTSNHWNKAMRLGNGQAIQLSGGGHQFGIGASEPYGLYFFSTSAENTEAAAAYRMVIRESGNVGIGTMYPAAQLDVTGTFKLGVTGASGGEAYCIGYTRAGNAQVFGQTAEGLLLGGDVNGIDMKIMPNGNVGIGTDNPTEKLAVNGTIRARKMTVTLNNWPDYVFKPGYRLPALAEIESFIQRNGHLPDMPPAEKVEKEGLDVGEMNKKLLQKIEELTLHLIEMEKKNKVLESDMKRLNEKVSAAGL